MPKTTITATAPDSSIQFTRKTDRSYTHAVLVKLPEGHHGAWAQGRHYEGGQWMPFSWCGRLDLARAQLSRAVEVFGQAARSEIVSVEAAA